MQQKPPFNSGFNADDLNYRGPQQGITRIITRPQLLDMTAKKAYDILVLFRDGFLTKQERKLSTAEKQQLWRLRHAQLNLHGHDAALDKIVGIFTVAGRAYAEKRLMADTPIYAQLGVSGTIPLRDGWSIIESAKKDGDPVAKEIAHNLQSAIYAVMPPQNNLKSDTGIRRINTSGK